MLGSFSRSNKPWLVLSPLVASRHVHSKVIAPKSNIIQDGVSQSKKDKKTAILKFDPTIPGPFTSFGIDPELVEYMQSKFPHIQKPTSSQRTILSSLSSSISIISRFPQGSGRSFALLLHTLNLHPNKSSLKSVILVPSNMALEQYEKKYGEAFSDKIAFFYDSNTQFVSERITTQSRRAPHTLITTAQTLLAYILKNKTLISQFERVLFFGVDEADFMLFDRSQRIHIGEKRRHSTVLEVLLTFINNARKKLLKVSPPLHIAFLSSFDTSSALKKKVVLADLDKRPLITVGAPTMENPFLVSPPIPAENITTNIVKVSKKRIQENNGVNKKVLFEDLNIGEVPIGVEALNVLKLGDEVEFDRKYDTYRWKKLNHLNIVKIPTYMVYATARVLKSFEYKSEREFGQERTSNENNDTEKTDRKTLNDKVKENLSNNLPYSNEVEKHEKKDDSTIESLIRDAKTLKETEIVSAGSGDDFSLDSEQETDDAVRRLDTESVEESPTGDAVDGGAGSRLPSSSTIGIDTISKEIAPESTSGEKVLILLPQTISLTQFGSKLQLVLNEPVDTISMNSNSSTTTNSKFVIAHTSSVVGVHFPCVKKIVCVGIDSIPSSYYLNMVCGRFRGADGLIDSKLNCNLVLLITDEDFSLLESHNLGRILTRSGISKFEKMFDDNQDADVFQKQDVLFRPSEHMLKMLLKN